MRKLLLGFLVVSFILTQAVAGHCVDKRVMLWDNVAKKQTTLADGSANQVVKTDGAGAPSWTNAYLPSGTDVVVADGGTGVSSFTAYMPICGGTTTTGTLQAVSTGTQYYPLCYNTSGSLPSFQLLPVAGGGTNKASWTQYLIPYADTTTSFSQIAIGTAGQVLKSAGAGSAPSFQNLDQGVAHKWSITVLAPNAVYTNGAVIPIGTALGALTVTRVICNTSSASYEVAGDVKYADARIGLGNATVINDFDTTSGTRDDSTIASGAVASGKFVYLQLDSAPSASMTDFTVDVYWDYD